MSNINQFFDLLFDPGESTSFGKFKEATKVYPVSSHSQHLDWVNLFCINPLHPTKDLNPYEDYHHEDRPRRCDKNVLVYRNILIEMDSIPLKEQMEHIQNLGMPWSAATYSGGKSIHWIISLEDPITTEKEYRKVIERLHKALGGKAYVDVACKNPSRFSRFPNVPRHDKDGKQQSLYKVQTRIKLADLVAFIDSKVPPEDDYCERYAEATGRSYKSTSQSSGILNGFTLNFIMMGAPEGERNQSLFRAACDMAKCGYDIEDAEARLEGPSGLTGLEVRRTIKSAYHKVQSEQ